MAITEVDTTQIQMQHAVNQKHAANKHASVLQASNYQSDEKKAKKEQLSSQSGTKASKSSKSKLSAVKDDIQLGADASNIGATDEQDSEGGGLMSGFGDHWEPDPLVEFMFENAPVLIELAQKGLKAMTDAQVAQAKCQMNNALESAQDTVKKGAAQASQQDMKAGGEFAQAGLAAMQAGLSLSDNILEDNTYSKDLDAHEGVLNGLKASPENTTSAGGSTQGTNPTASLNKTVSNAQGGGMPDALEEAAIRQKAQDFKKIQSQKFDEKLNGYKETLTRKDGTTYEKNHAGLDDNLKSKMKKRNWMGLGKSPDVVEAENKVLANRYASREAFREVLGDRANGVVDCDYVDPTDGKAYQGSISQKGLDELLKGDTVKAQEGRKIFMQELFGEEAGGTPLDMEERMNLVGDWGSKGRSLRKEMLQTYGATQEGASMRQAFTHERDLASNKARLESDHNRRRMEKRQLLFQNLSGSGANALFDFLQHQYITTAANRESEASLDSSMAQVWGQAQSTENGTISQLIQDMTGILDWFNQAHSQLLSAQTSAAGV